jgi:phosphate transport system permease protein
VSDAAETPDLGRTNRLKQVKESTYGGLFAICAVITLLTTVGIFATLLADAVAFFSEVPFADFFFGTDWSPSPAGGGFEWGIVPLVIGTLTVTFTAAFIALPIGTLTAIYLSEYASPNVRSVLKPMLEILAGIPTVVYGYFALVYVTPALQATLFPSMSTFNALSASLMIGIMTIPMVSSISEDAMNAVPDSLRQAGYGLGATKFQVSTGVVIPASISGIVSSYILAVSRAIGETMIVVVAMGAQARMPTVNETVFGIPYFHPGEILLDSGMTITVAMVQIAGGDLIGGTLPYDAMFALGLALFVVTLIMNILSDIIAERYREEY